MSARREDNVGTNSADVEALMAAARSLPQGDDAVWEGRRIIWKQPETWAPALTAWLEPDFRRATVTAWPVS
jgi:hypothetical protein